MSDILEWLYNDKPIDSQPLLQVQIPKPIPIGETINEEIVHEPIDEIDRGTYCPQCNMLTPGLPCGMDENCPW